MTDCMKNEANNRPQRACTDDNAKKQCGKNEHNTDRRHSPHALQYEVTGLPTVTGSQRNNGRNKNKSGYRSHDTPQNKNDGNNYRCKPEDSSHSTHFFQLKIFSSMVYSTCICQLLFSKHGQPNATDPGKKFAAAVNDKNRID